MDPKVIALLALIVGAVVRLLKADKLNEMLATLSIPAIPKAALPWVALSLGFAGAVFDSAMGGAEWGAALVDGLNGIVAGALAVAGNEALKPAAHAMHEPTATLLFGNAAPKA